MTSFYQVFRYICRKVCGNITGCVKIVWREMKNFYFCRRVSPVRPAPAESPQGRKAARVGGCSGATQVAYPLFRRKNVLYLVAKILRKCLVNIKKLLSFAAADKNSKRSE